MERWVGFEGEGGFGWLFGCLVGRLVGRLGGWKVGRSEVGWFRDR